MAFCTACGQRLAGGERFCGECGNVLSPAPAAPAPAAAAPQPPAPDAPSLDVPGPDAQVPDAQVPVAPADPCEKAATSPGQPMARWAVGEGPVPLPPRRRSTWRTMLTFGLPVVMVAGGLLGLLNLFRSDGVPRVASRTTSAMTPPANASQGTAGGTGLTGGAATTTSSQAPTPSVPRVTATTARQQARALDKLLDEADRTPVAATVASLARCDATSVEASTAATTLRTAATNRNDLLHRLQDVPVEALPDGPALRDALKEIWSSWEKADRQYLAWAQTIASGYPCNPRSPYRNAGDVAAENAKRDGEEFVAIWNAKVAGPQLLAKRRVSDL